MSKLGVGAPTCLGFDGVLGSVIGLSELIQVFWRFRICDMLMDRMDECSEKRINGSREISSG